MLGECECVFHLGGILLAVIRFCVLLLAGTNEEAITEVLARRTVAQRQRIKEAYKQSVGKVRERFDRAVLKPAEEMVSL